MRRERGRVIYVKWMKRILALAIVAALSMGCFAALASKDAAKYVYASGQVNVRSGPGLGYGSIGTMYEGERRLFLEKTSVDDRGVTWYQVQYNSSRTGWVSSVYSDIIAGADDDWNWDDSTDSYVKATGGQSNLRSGPGLGYEDIGTMHLGDTAEYLGDQSVDGRGVTWYYVEFDGEIGWVSSRYTTLYAGESYGEEERVVKATGQVNVRSGPGLDYKDIGTLYKGDTADYLGKSSVDDRGVTWYQIRFNSGTGWVSSRHSRLVGGGYDDDDDDDDEETVSGTYVKATRGQSNLRSGPGLSYEDLGTLHRGEQATFLDDWSVDDRGVMWYYVNFDGKIGWVSSRYTTLY